MRSERGDREVGPTRCFQRYFTLEGTARSMEQEATTWLRRETVHVHVPRSHGGLTLPVAK